MNRVSVIALWLFVVFPGAIAFGENAAQPTASERSAAVELKLDPAQIEQLMKSGELKKRSAAAPLDMEIALSHKIDLGKLRADCKDCATVDPLPIPIPIAQPPCPKEQKSSLPAAPAKPYVFQIRGESEKVADALAAARIDAGTPGKEATQPFDVTVRIKNLSKADAETLAARLIEACPQCKAGVDPLPTPTPIVWPPKCPKQGGGTR